ncbi:bifunctional [glutamate--ammonia ligase]-adenylyl-L-tyrosine phosphorylase/[glutamate--ammonia-ligase] adenylyltransferase [Endothiovibrio diazotrophicus]
MNSTSPPFDSLPESIRPAAEALWTRFVESLGERALPDAPRLLAALPAVFAASEYVAESCARDPGLLIELWQSGDLGNDGYGAYDAYVARLDGWLEGVETEEALGSALRRFRRREMVRIAWRELAGWAPVEETLEETSWLAEACIDGALQRLHPWFCRIWGTPRDPAGEEQRLVVLGMGKLGAWELNFSSDVDLIYAYPHRGETDGRRAVDNEEFFVRLGRALTNALDTTTYEGFVFRVDLRLRPYGESGPPVLSFGAMEEYYQSQGRSWERYAMIKARVVAGDRAAGAELIEMLRPFIYRRYLDFGSFESLREMKGMIERELVRKGMAENVKLGPGGIREVEFIGQALQLIFGGREPALRERRILEVLARLTELGHLPAYASRRLVEAYRFLRRVENRLQEWRDEQTQLLPEDEAGRARLAFAMGFADWAAFSAALKGHRRAVQERFEQTFYAPQAEEGDHAGASPDLAALWRGELEAERAVAVLTEAGFERTEEPLRRLQQLREGRARRHTGEQGRRWMDRLIPLLLGAVGGAAGGAGRADEVLVRLIDLIEAIAGRTAYLALLVENPMALSQLTRLCAASPWIAAYLVRHPALIDELLDSRTLYRPLVKAELVEELARRMANVAAGDQEGQMEALRRFKHPNVLRVAAADLSGGAAFTVMKVSDYLTWIAEAVLDQALAVTREQLVKRHGVPRCVVDGVEREADLLVVGYGKLGGIELGYGSDLDLVFLHDSAGERQATAGERSLDNDTFFARLGQRLIHTLDTLTPSGVLYEVDMRLRPHGNSGALVVSLEAYADYLRNEAWTWEHQALVRARAITRERAPQLAERFDAIREEILRRPRDREVLRVEVREMRQKMRDNLDKSGRDENGVALFDLKQGRSGIVDIEFIVQYLVLGWAAEYPELTLRSDDMRTLDTCAAVGLIEEDERERLQRAYRAYRTTVHRCKLAEQPARVAEAEVAELRAGVAPVWGRLLEAHRFD